MSAGGGYSRRSQQPERPRSNQPTGYRRQYGGESRRYYGRRHDYVYYPVAWIDADTGKHYESGYYDETGQHYDNVSFAQNGRYENVVCHCPYCDHESIISISTTEESDKSLACPNCGATMEIRSALDDYVNQETYRTAEDYGMERAAGGKKKRRGLRGLLIGLIVAALALVGLGAYGSKLMKEEAVEQYNIEQDAEEEFSQDYGLGSTVGLAKTGDNSYVVSESGGDKTLVWDAGADSYYDEESDCWLWYNTDVEPAVWQYWYEGISSDYGDYGWMEHDEDGWFIEADYGDWIELPEKYDAGSLWYIE